MLIIDDVFWEKKKEEEERKSSNSSPSLDKDWSPTKKNGFLSRRRPNNCYSHDPIRYKIIDTARFQWISHHCMLLIWSHTHTHI